jgi:hypothetical protein
MSNINILQQAVVKAALDFTDAREKLTQAEYEYNSALKKNSHTHKAVDQTKAFQFSNAGSTITDC